MEALLFRLISIAFVLLTLTLASGVLFSESLFGQAFRVDHKTMFAFVSWFPSAGCWSAATSGLARPRLALRWTLAGFVALMLAYRAAADSSSKWYCIAPEPARRSPPAQLPVLTAS